MQRFEGSIEAGLWKLVPRVGGTVWPCAENPGRWLGIMTVSGEIARAMASTPTNLPFLLRTDSGQCFAITATRWWPVGSSAKVEFVGDTGESPSVETDPEFPAKSISA